VEISSESLVIVSFTSQILKPGLVFFLRLVMSADRLAKFYSRPYQSPEARSGRSERFCSRGYPAHTMSTSTPDCTLRLQGPRTEASPALLRLDHERSRPRHVHNQIKNHQIRSQLVRNSLAEVTCFPPRLFVRRNSLPSETLLK
jgi:hypothetical protein